jgi:hypothetical protein
MLLLLKEDGIIREKVRIFETGRRGLQKRTEVKMGTTDYGRKAEYGKKLTTRCYWRREIERWKQFIGRSSVIKKCNHTCRIS